VGTVERIDAGEEALVRGLTLREPDAVSTFVERTHRAVYAKARRLTDDDELCQDWTHNVLLRILDELATGNFVYRWPGCFWSWFGKRAHFLLLNQYNQQRKQLERFQGGEAGECALEGIAMPEGQTPDRLLENVEIRATLEECLRKLPSDDHRRVLTLLLFEEMSYEDIAHVLATPLNTIRSWIRRGRISMRKCMSLAFAIEGGSE
jgi:RNA polymerase sigma-70 factor (ECF subfamily)